MSLLNYERNELDSKYWLQFDSKNQEFYGIPKPEDVGQREYVLVAEDHEGLQATDALVVVVTRSNTEYNNAFEFTLNIPYEDFNNSLTQRRFVERVAQIFGDDTTSNIQLRSIRMIHATGMTQVTFFNTTLYRPHNVCPTEEIDTLKNILMAKDGTIRARVKNIIGNEFALHKIHFAPRGPCLLGQENIHHAGVPGIKQEPGDIVEKDDNLLTIVLPGVIILSMLFLTCIIACILYRKRSTGKLELGKYGNVSFHTNYSLIASVHFWPPNQLTYSILLQVMKRNAGRSVQKEFQSYSKMNWMKSPKLAINHQSS